MICLLTPAGGRPDALTLLARYLDAQTYSGELRWVIIDDCNPASPLPDSRYDVEVIRPSWRWQPGDNTQCRSMALALEQVGDDDTVIIAEDDDVYLPDHLAATLNELETTELVGERISRYYNVATQRWQSMPGKVHASLASNGVRGDALALLREICRMGSSRNIDLDLWRHYRGQKRLTEHANVIGIKGLPGRAGIGIGHRAGFGRPDTDNTLYRWLGDYAESYQPFRRDA